MTSMLKALQKIQAKGEHLVEAAAPQEIPPPASQPAVATGDELLVGLYGLAPSVAQELVVVQPDARRTSCNPANSTVDRLLVPVVDVQPIAAAGSADSVHLDRPDADIKGVDSMPSPDAFPVALPEPAPEAPPETHPQECDLSDHEQLSVTEVGSDDCATAGRNTECRDLGNAAPAEPEPDDQVPVDEVPVDEVPVDEGPVDEGPVDDKPVDRERLDCKPIEPEPVDLEPVHCEPGFEEPVDHEPVDDEPVDHEPVTQEMSGSERMGGPLADGNREVPPVMAPGFSEQLRDIPAFESDIESAKTWVLDDEPPRIAESSRSDSRGTDPEEMARAMLDPFPGDDDAGGDDHPDAEAGGELTHSRRDAEATEEIRLLDEIEELLLPEHSALWSASDDVDDLLSDDELDCTSDFPPQVSRAAFAEDEEGGNADRGCAVAPETARENSTFASETESLDPSGDDALGAPSADWSDDDAPRLDVRSSSGPPGDVAVASHSEETNTAIASPLPSGNVAPDGRMAIEVLHTTVASALAAEAAVECASPASSSQETVPVPTLRTLEMTDFELEICGDLNEAQTSADYDILWSNIRTNAGPAARSAATKPGLSNWIRQRRPVAATAEEAGASPRSLVFACIDSEVHVAEVLAHLAIYLTTRCQLRVLLVDANLEGAMLTEHFGAATESSTGVSELCRDETAVPTVHQTATGPAIVSTGVVQVGGLDFQPERVTRFVTSQLADYDIILVDGGACQGPLFHGLAESCDRTYLLAQLGKSARDQAATQVQALLAAGVRLSGCVVTNAPAGT